MRVGPIAEVKLGNHPNELYPPWTEDAINLRYEEPYGMLGACIEIRFQPRHTRDAQKAFGMGNVGICQMRPPIVTGEYDNDVRAQCQTLPHGGLKIREAHIGLRE